MFLSRETPLEDLNMYVVYSARSVATLQFVLLGEFKNSSMRFRTGKTNSRYRSFRNLFVDT